MAGICTQPVSGSMIPVHVQPDIVVRQQSDVPVARFLGRGAGARGQPERAGSIGSRARAFAFVAGRLRAARRACAGEADSAPLEVLACDAASRRSAAHGIAPGAGRGMPAAVPRVEAGLRVPIAGQVARIGACLERLCALQGDASTVTRTALMHGVVARALGTRNVGQLLRGRGLGEHRTLTSAEEDFKRGQLRMRRCRKPCASALPKAWSAGWAGIARCCA